MGGADLHLDIVETVDNIRRGRIAGLGAFQGVSQIVVLLLSLLERVFLMGKVLRPLLLGILPSSLSGPANE
jgi:hypothetical protein